VIGSDLRNPDFAALARSYGALGVQVRLAAEFAPALQQALAHEGPALIEVCTELEQLYVGGTLSDLRAQSLARQAERKGGD
jgi:acetolactate synthase-1/2/3 large subunit